MYAQRVILLLLIAFSKCHSFILDKPRGSQKRAASASFLLNPLSSFDMIPPFETFASIDSAPTTAAAFGLLLWLASLAVSRPPSQVLSSSQLSQITQGTYLQKDTDNLNCVYKASRDGWSAQAFHSKVDNLGSAVVAVKVLGGSVIGGFNPNGWRSTDDYYFSNQAFLWTLVNNGSLVKKLPIVSGGNSPSLFDYATAGLCFGTCDLRIGPPQAAIMGGFAGPDMEDTSANSGNLRQGTSSVVNYEWSNQWPVRGGFRIVEVEVYLKL